jgi:hypothetical protein
VVEDVAYVGFGLLLAGSALVLLATVALDLAQSAIG